MLFNKLLLLESDYSKNLIRNYRNVVVRRIRLNLRRKSGAARKVSSR